MTYSIKLYSPIFVRLKRAEHVKS